MKIITFNLRNALADDGQNSWRYRRDFVVEYLLASDADIICMQEVVPAVKSDLSNALAGVYEVAGEGRMAEKRDDDEINLVAYKKNEFTLLQKEHFWLSETPEIPGSRFSTQLYWPRTCTHLSLKNKYGVYEIYATHLDNADIMAREHGLELILQRAGDAGKIFVCGDMNDVPHNVHKWIHNRLIDLTDGVSYTYNGYGKERSKIDYIFASREIKKLSNCVCVSEIRDNIYISDHFPLWVEAE